MSSFIKKHEIPYGDLFWRKRPQKKKYSHDTPRRGFSESALFFSDARWIHACYHMFLLAWFLCASITLVLCACPINLVVRYVIPDCSVCMLRMTTHGVFRPIRAYILQSECHYLDSLYPEACLYARPGLFLLFCLYFSQTVYLVLMYLITHGKVFINPFI